MKADTFTLGAELEDVVSGFRGIATGRAEYLTGCTQYCLVPKVDAEGKVRAGEWFDEQRLEKVGEGVTTTSRDTGGPQRDAPHAR